jgi:hypothetical protein
MQASDHHYTVPSQIRFAEADPYRTLTLPPCARVRQSPAASGFFHTERHLQCIWFDDTLRPDGLKTRDGEMVTVISPGRWNLEAGPDFLDATLSISGPDSRLLRGDIEIHIHPADWSHHGHASDPRYRRLIAHVTFSPVGTTSPALPPGTVEISLRDALAAIPSFSMDAVDLTAYPYAAACEHCPCAEAIRTWHPDRTAAMLEAAGAFRMEQKANRFAAQFRHLDAGTILYRETMAALGYKQNSGGFRALADRVPPDALAPLTPLDAYALLLGVSGLLPETPSPRWTRETRVFFRQVWDAWWPLQSRWGAARLPPEAWTLSSLRPQNHPIRRLAAAAGLFAGNREPLLERLRSSLQRYASLDSVVPLFAATPPLDHWLLHLGPGSDGLSTPTALVGSARLATWYTNVALPLLAAGGTDITPLLATLPPEQSNSIIRQTAFRLLGRDHNPSLYARNGLRQQGLMQIFHDFCLSERAGCATCRFPDALRIPK